MTAPDVRVRLSAEGVDEIVRTFQKVSAAAKKTGKESSLGFKALHDGLEGIKELLPAIGVGAAVVGLVELVKGAIESADAVGKLSQKTGISVETLSSLKVAATLADVEFDGLSSGIAKFNKTMGELDRGSTKAGGAVRMLLGSSAALNGLDTNQRFEKVVTAIGAMAPGYNKTRAAQDFFGKSGADLIPLMDDLAHKGFAGVRQEAERLGLLLGPAFVDAATRAADAMKVIKLQAQGLATQFSTGFVPALAGAMEALTEATTGGNTSMFQKLGEGVGAVIKTLVGGFLIVGKTIGYVFGEAGLLLDDFKGRAKDTAAGVGTFFKQILGSVVLHDPFAFLNKQDFAGMAGSNQFLQRLTAFSREVADLFESIEHPKKPPADTGGAVTMIESLKARLDQEKAALENELALSKKRDDVLAAQQQRAFEAGGLSIDAYYAKREQAIKDGAMREANVLRQELTLLQQTPLDIKKDESDDQVTAKRIKRAQDVAAVSNKIALAELDRQQKLEQNDAAHNKDQASYGQARLDLEKQIADAQGNTFAGAIKAIDKQSAALSKLHLPPELIAQLNQLDRARAAFAEFERAGALATGALSLAQSQIQQQVASGDLFPFQAVERYDALIQQVLPQLRALAEAEKNAATTPEDRLKAEQFSNSIEAMGTSASKSARQLVEIRAGLESGLQQSIGGFLSSGIDQVQGFADGVRALAVSVLDSVRQIVAGLASKEITQGLLSLLPGSSKGAGDATAQAEPLVGAATDLQIAGGVLVGAGTAMNVGAANIMASAVALSAAAAALVIAQQYQAAVSVASSFTSNVAFADGGFVAGPGTATSDSIPARLSAGEFVMNARSVARPGMLAMLSHFNAGANMPSLAPPSSVAHFAAGGLVESGAANDARETHVKLSLDPGLVAEHINSGPGEKAVLRVLQRNRNAVKQSLK
jgi:hypothetical protein